MDSHKTFAIIGIVIAILAIGFLFLYGGKNAIFGKAIEYTPECKELEEKFSTTIDLREDPQYLTETILEKCSLEQCKEINQKTLMNLFEYEKLYQQSLEDNHLALEYYNNIQRDLEILSHESCCGSLLNIIIKRLELLQNEELNLMLQETKEIIKNKCLEEVKTQPTSTPEQIPTETTQPTIPQETISQPTTPKQIPTETTQPTIPQETISQPTTTTQETSDINKLTNSDANYLAQELAKTENIPYNENTKKYDVNLDGKIDIKDVVIIIKNS